MKFERAAARFASRGKAARRARSRARAAALSVVSYEVGKFGLVRSVLFRASRPDNA